VLSRRKPPLFLCRILLNAREEQNKVEHIISTSAVGEAIATRPTLNTNCGEKNLCEITDNYRFSASAFYQKGTPLWFVSHEPHFLVLHEQYFFPPPLAGVLTNISVNVNM